MQETLSSPPHNMPFKQQWLPAHWTLLEVEALTSPEPVTLHTQLPIMPWVLEATPCKLSIATKVSLLQDRNKSGPSGISHLQAGMALPCSHSDVMVLEEVTPLPNPLNTWRPVWIQLSESNRSSTLLTPILSLMDKLAVQWTASWPLHMLELTGDLLLFIP